jgi:hypothetical protein
MEWLNRFFRTGTGATVGCLAALCLCVALYVEVRNSFSPPGIAALKDATFICSETGKAYTHVLVLGDSIPLYSPYSGKNTGYPAEFCYWTADGHIKDTPTPVLLNSYIGVPGPTFCPDCGRLVVARNPRPGPNSKPPPTREEYERMHATAGN